MRRIVASKPWAERRPEQDQLQSIQDCHRAKAVMATIFKVIPWMVV
jgi:hypothetical protein